MKKFLVLLLAASELALIPAQDTNLSVVEKRKKALSDNPKQKSCAQIRAYLHDGAIDSCYKGTYDAPAVPPHVNPWDTYPQHLLESYKMGHVLSRTERATVIIYLRQQIAANDLNYTIWCSERMPYVVQAFGFFSTPLRWCLRECYSYFGNWQADLAELSVQETTETL